MKQAIETSPERQNAGHRTKITIIGGTGAVGSYFAMKLAGRGHELSVLGRHGSANLERTMHSGFRWLTSEGEVTAIPEEFYYIGSQHQHLTKQDLIIVALKQPDLTEAVAEQIAELSDGRTIVGVISNGLPFYFLRGLDLDKRFLDAVDEGGRITHLLRDINVVCIQPVIAAEVGDSGITAITRPLDKISVTVASPTADNHEALNRVYCMFSEAGINSSLSLEKAHKPILEKLQFALSINVPSALMDKPIDEVFNSRDTQPFIAYVIDLVNAIASILNIEGMRDCDKFKSLSITKGHFSSLHKDIARGRPAEIDAIVTATLELARYVNENSLAGLPSLELLERVQRLLYQKVEQRTYITAEVPSEGFVARLLNLCSDGRFLAI